MSVHARISDPLDLRRDILECAIFSTDAVRFEEKLKELSKEKKKLRNQLKYKLNDLNKIVKSFEKKMPRLPDSEKLHAHREEMRELLNEEREDEMGGQVKSIEQVRKEVEKLKNKDVKVLKKKAEQVNERENMRRDLESIRSRISRLSRVMPE